MPIDNMIRRMNAGDIIKKTETNALDCKLALEDVQHFIIFRIMMTIQILKIIYIN
jgi:hypothetical protein